MVGQHQNGVAGSVITLVTKQPTLVPLPFGIVIPISLNDFVIVFVLTRGPIVIVIGGLDQPLTIVFASPLGRNMYAPLRSFAPTVP